MFCIYKINEYANEMEMEMIFGEKYDYLLFMEWNGNDI